MPETNIMQGLGNAFNHIDPEHVSNGQLYSLLYAMHAQQLEAHRELTELKAQLAEHKTGMKDMMEMWRTGVGVLRFIKVLGAIGIPLAAIVAIAKLGMVKLFGGI